LIFYLLSLKSFLGKCSEPRHFGRLSAGLGAAFTALLRRRRPRGRGLGASSKTFREISEGSNLALHGYLLCYPREEEK